jgi:short subunit dehydrogenase-like uncharacterized protein
MQGTVVVFGATGFTGRLIVEALVQHGLRDLRLGGRDEGKLRALSAQHGGLPFQRADVSDAAALDRLLTGARVVIDVAGPFIELGEPIVQAALARGVHVLDTTGEQPYMLRILERYDEAARAKRLAVVNAHAFEYALGYCAGALAVNEPRISELDVHYRVRAGSLTRGTRKSILAVAMSPRSLEFRDGVLCELNVAAVRRGRAGHEQRRLFALPIPGGEALHLPRNHPELRRVTSHIVTSAASLLPLLGAWSLRPLASRLTSKSIIAGLSRRIDAGPEGPSAAMRERQRFCVTAVGIGAGHERVVTVHGRDPYGLTAQLAALGAKQLLGTGPRAVGVVSSDAAFGARELLDSLVAHGVSWEVHPSSAGR